MSMFLVHILSMPALIHQIENSIPECSEILHTHKILERSLQLLGTDQSLKITVNSMKGTQSLALLANLINLFYLEPMESAAELAFPSFTVRISKYSADSKYITLLSNYLL